MKTPRPVRHPRPLGDRHRRRVRHRPGLCRGDGRGGREGDADRHRRRGAPSARRSGCGARATRRAPTGSTSPTGAPIAPVFDEHAAAYGGLDICLRQCRHRSRAPASGTPPATAIPTARSTPSRPERWDRTIAINLTGVYDTIREAARLMKAARQGGSIIATSSNAGAGLRADRRHALYGRPRRGCCTWCATSRWSSPSSASA